MITENSIHIRIKNYKGTWQVIASTIYQDKKIFLLQHEQLGEKTGHLIVDENGDIVRVELLK